MRTVIYLSVTIFMFTSLVINSVSSFHQTIEQLSLSSENQEIIAKNNSKKTSKGKGTPYRGSGRRSLDFM